MWGQILNEKNRISSLLKLNEIKDCFLNYDFTSQSFSLCNGSFGVIYFLLTYGKIYKDKTAEEKGILLIEAALNNIKIKDLDYSLIDGLSGFVIFLKLVKKSLKLSIDIDLSNIEKSIYVHGIHDIKEGYFDFLYGGCGKLYSVLDNTHIMTKQNQEELLKAFIDKSEKRQNLTTWQNFFDYSLKKNLNKEFNLGIAHGMLAVLNLICNFKNLKNNVILTRTIEQCSNWILSQKLDNCRSLYPYFGDTKNSTENSSRLGWCYGDLGVAFTLRRCGEFLKNSKFIDAADEAIIFTLSRKTVPSTGIANPWFCHGSSGVMHLLSRYYVENKTSLIKHESEIKDTINYWNEKTIELLNISDDENFGLLEGLSGVGLAIICQLHPIEPAWDNFFLLR